MLVERLHLEAPAPPIPHSASRRNSVLDKLNAVSLRLSGLSPACRGVRLRHLVSHLAKSLTYVIGSGSSDSSEPLTPLPATGYCLPELLSLVTRTQTYQQGSNLPPFAPAVSHPVGVEPTLSVASYLAKSLTYERATPLFFFRSRHQVKSAS